MDVPNWVYIKHDLIEPTKFNSSRFRADSFYSWSFHQLFTLLRTMIDARAFDLPYLFRLFIICLLATTGSIIVFWIYILERKIEDDLGKSGVTITDAHILMHER